MLLYVMNPPPSLTDLNGSNDTEIAPYYSSPESICAGITSTLFQSPYSVNNSTDIVCSNCSKRCSGCCPTVQAFYSDNK
jgi:hypothetical protein